ncbi:MAG: hypothetical protein FIA92_14205 [Chloroflexi bacterium]|nr:hypothetical protein [Chloroflexota bacterium]
MLADRSPGERSAIVLGVVLIVLGGLTLLGRALSIDVLGIGWPLLVIAPGVALFAVGVGVGGPAGVAFAIPGGIVTMVGTVLAVQAATGLWATWAYAWALVAPGGVGAGMLLYGIIANQRDIARTGLPILLTGLGLFLGFGLFFEGVLHLSGPDLPIAEPALAVGLVVLGVLVLLSGVVGGRRRA